jgi:nitrogen regulatory protein P-II 1
VDEVIDVVMQSARTGDIGDGRIWVMDVPESYNIRTGARDV